MARIGVVLSGCGVFDGAEIHESVLTLLAIDEAGHEAVIMAPRGPQMHVINHATGDVTGETRDVFVESSRIARGAPTDLALVGAADLDALVFPGGFGAAKNLSDFAVKGAGCAVHPEVARLVGEMHAARKPIGFACISPAVGAAIFRDAGVTGVQLTVGADEDGAARAINAMGGAHVACSAREARTDREHKIVSTPCYMSAAGISEVRAGTRAMVDGVLGLM